MLDSNATAGRLVLDPLGVFGVDIGKVGHIGEEDGDLDDTLDGGIGGLENCLDVLEDGGRLLANGTLDQFALGVARNRA